MSDIPSSVRRKSAIPGPTTPRSQFATPQRRIRREATTPHTIRALAVAAATPGRRISRLIKISKSTPRDDLRALSRALVKEKRDREAIPEQEVKKRRTQTPVSKRPITKSTTPFQSKGHNGKRFYFPETTNDDEIKKDDEGTVEYDEKKIPDSSPYRKVDPVLRRMSEPPEYHDTPIQSTTFVTHDSPAHEIETERRFSADRLSVDRRFSNAFDIADSTIGSRRDTFGFPIADISLGNITNQPSFHIQLDDNEITTEYETTLLPGDESHANITTVNDNEMNDDYEYENVNFANDYENEDEGNNTFKDYDASNVTTFDTDQEESDGDDGPIIGEENATIGYDDMDDVDNMTLPIRLPRPIDISKPKSPRKPQTKNTKPETAIPRKIIKDILKTVSSSRITSEAFEQIITSSDSFFEQATEDLSAYAKHAKRKTIDSSDVIQLIRRQRFLGNTTPFSLAYKYLPAEFLNDLQNKK